MSMRNLLTYDLFEKKKFHADFHPLVLGAIEKFFKVDSKVKSILDDVVFPAANLIKSGSTRIPSVKHRKFIEELVNYKFPGGPNFVSAERFSKMAVGKELLYRGVQSEKYQDDLEYDISKFRGSTNMYQGTWVTDDKEYAGSFHYDKGNPLELLLKDDANIIEDDEADKLRGDFATAMNDVENEALDMDDDTQYKTALYQAKYLKENIDATFLSVMKGYDAVRLYQRPGKADRVASAKAKDSATVYVVFNRSKLIVKK